MMFMRHIFLCIILQLVHTENCADLKNVEFAGSIINKRCQNSRFSLHTVYKQIQIIQTFFIYFIQNAVLRRKKSSSGQGRSESKKNLTFGTKDIKRTHRDLKRSFSRTLIDVSYTTTVTNGAMMCFTY